MNRFRIRFDPALIPELAKRYTYPDEDKMLSLIGPSAMARVYFTKDEFQDLCRWKSQRTRSRVDSNRAEFIKEATKIALATPIEEIRIGVLNLLHGVSWPTASTVLHFSHRDPYPIIDFRALWSLGIEKRPQFYTFEYWWDYTRFCRDLARKQGVSMRDLDRALWQYSKENQPTEQA